MTKPPLERAARALCSLQGLPENTKFEGRPMWESFLPNARVALEAIREPSEAMKGASDRIAHARDEEIWRAMIDAALSE